jgi:hypothetical protein
VSRIDLIKSRRDGWGVVDQYVCRGCTKEFLKCSSLDILELVNQKQGQLPSKLNHSLSFDMYKSGIGVTRAAERFGYAGIHSMLVTEHQKSERTIKQVIQPLSKE